MIEGIQKTGKEETLYDRVVRGNRERETERERK